MQLKSVTVINYRSIVNLEINISPFADGSQTYGLIGVNEAGKTSFLKALALKDGIKDTNGQNLPTLKDFTQKQADIQINFKYQPDEKKIAKFKDLLKEQPYFKDLTSEMFSFIEVSFIFKSGNPAIKEILVSFPEIKNISETFSTINQILKDEIISGVHKTVFWTAEDRYLISNPINLSQFAANPDAVSIPLRNCFLLSGIKNVQERISMLTGDSTEVEFLENELGTKVTKHIKKVWKKHPIEITFKISDGHINFHVKDEGFEGRAKTADQRSDGFKQFISFLLTISAQSTNEELNNTILLLDEPETHLHPQAQENLLQELIKISTDKKSNVVFFATHSNYMIDKKNINRNFRVKKSGTQTRFEKINGNEVSFAKVSYDVFGVISDDYHNEIYDFLRAKFSEEKGKDMDDIGIREFDEEFLKQKSKLVKTYKFKGEDNAATLPTYIRNCIHYPTNKDTKFDQRLVESIETMIKLL